MKIIYLLISTVSLTIVTACSVNVPKHQAPDTGTNSEKPNIVLVLADDIGLGDIGFYHRQRTGKPPIVETPNIDGLVNSGMRFSDAHSAASLCAPSRYAMLTGNYPDRGPIFGVWLPHSNARIDPDFTTSARIAKSAGYRTAFFGKWGIGGVWKNRDYDPTVIENGAMHYGFDYALELPDGIQNSPLAFYKNKQWMKLDPDSEFVTLSREQAQFAKKTGRKIAKNLLGDSNWNPALVGPILSDDAKQYIERHARMNDGVPFFMYYSSQAVHIPHTPAAQFNGVALKGTTPGAHGDMIRELDFQVGKLVTALKETGQLDNTLFVFTSDNGGLEIDENMQRAGHMANNGLRGKKGSIYEGGHRVPFIAVWPNQIEASSKSDLPIVAHDIVSTIAAIGEQTINRNVVLDSLNLLPTLMQDEPREKRKYMINQSKAGPYFAIRNSEWKLILKAKGPADLKSLVPIGLYNLKDNLAENEAKNFVDDLAQQTRIAEMLTQYIKHRTGTTPSVVQW